MDDSINRGGWKSKSSCTVLRVGLEGGIKNLVSLAKALYIGATLSPNISL